MENKELFLKDLESMKSSQSFVDLINNNPNLKDSLDKVFSQLLYLANQENNVDEIEELIGKFNLTIAGKINIDNDINVDDEYDVIDNINFLKKSAENTLGLSWDEIINTNTSTNSQQYNESQAYSNSSYSYQENSDANQTNNNYSSQTNGPINLNVDEFITKNNISVSDIINKSIKRSAQTYLAQALKEGKINPFKTQPKEMKYYKIALMVISMILFVILAGSLIVAWLISDLDIQVEALKVEDGKEATKGQLLNVTFSVMWFFGILVVIMAVKGLYGLTIKALDSPNQLYASHGVMTAMWAFSLILGVNLLWNSNLLPLFPSINELIEGTHSTAKLFQVDAAKLADLKHLTKILMAFEITTWCLYGLIIVNAVLISQTKPEKDAQLLESKLTGFENDIKLGNLKLIDPVLVQNDTKPKSPFGGLF